MTGKNQEKTDSVAFEVRITRSTEKNGGKLSTPSSLGFRLMYVYMKRLSNAITFVINNRCNMF